MKFTLKDYQADAVDDVLANLKRARENFKNPDKAELSSFSLTATTGAGKTVMFTGRGWVVDSHTGAP